MSSNPTICIDGGGIRGYSSLLILKALMLKIMEIEANAGYYCSSDYPWMAAGTQKEEYATVNNLEGFSLVIILTTLQELPREGK